MNGVKIQLTTKDAKDEHPSSVKIYIQRKAILTRSMIALVHRPRHSGVTFWELKYTGEVSKFILDRLHHRVLEAQTCFAMWYVRCGRIQEESQLHPSDIDVAANSDNSKSRPVTTSDGARGVTMKTTETNLQS